jgi:hypothetical protein
MFTYIKNIPIKWREFIAKGKGYITISVPNNTTQEDIKKIRYEFSQSEYAKDYKLNILVSGNEDIKKTLSNIILEEIRRKLP